MALQLAALQPGLTLTTDVLPLYTVQGTHTAIVKAAVFANRSTAAASLTVNVTRSAGGSLAVIAARSLAAGETYVARELAGLVLLSGDGLTAQCSAAGAIGTVISGIVQ